MACEISHSVLGGDIRITLHLLHVLVSGSTAFVSECCLEVLNWVFRGFRGYSGAMLCSIVDRGSAPVLAALGSLPQFQKLATQFSQSLAHIVPVFRREQSLPPVLWEPSSLASLSPAPVVSVHERGYHYLQHCGSCHHLDNGLPLGQIARV